MMRGKVKVGLSGEWGFCKSRPCMYIISTWVTSKLGGGEDYDIMNFFRSENDGGMELWISCIVR